MTSGADAWKGEELVRKYLDGIRGAIPLASEQIDVLLRVVASAGLRVARFADLGCGGGALAQALLKRYPNANATLVDFSEAMVDEARAALAPYGDQCVVALSDLSDAAWLHVVESRAPFDVVVSGYAIHHLSDERKRALYGEVFELLAPGGFFVNIEHVASPNEWLASVFDELLIDSFYAHESATGSGKDREQVAREYVHRSDKQANILAPVEDQCAWLVDCGFVDVDCYFKLFELAVFGGRKLPSE